jgi:divalent metal cation (Fe/Co/Zn/Cd) transporter
MIPTSFYTITVMTDSPTTALSVRSRAVARIRLLSRLTLAWLAIDGALGMTAGITANSVALIGWGLDCAIQSAAALILIWRFSDTRAQSQVAEQVAQRVIAVSFFLLVPYIVTVAINQLASGGGANGSWLGVGLAATDALLMPVLGTAKKRAGSQVGSYATARAGVQNIICAYLSVAVLVGLAANAMLGWWWADPTAALLVAVSCLLAGITTWRGEKCDDGACA